MDFAGELAILFRRDLTRLVQELEAFPDDGSLWKTAPGVSNPGGNLALHLEGNLREYIGRQLGGVAYTRKRAEEFGLREVARDELVRRAVNLRDWIPEVIRALSLEALDARYPEDVLGSPLSTRHFLLSLYGHFNYHLGQIDYIRRTLTGNGAIPLAGLEPGP